MDDTLRHDTRTPTGVLDVAAVRAFHDRLDDLSTDNPLEAVRALAELQNAISARQAHLVVAADEAQQARDIPRGITARDTTREVGSQIGFARRCSGQRGAAFLNLAHTLVEDMPRTLAALAAGVISEWDATRVVRETAGLTRDGRADVDAAIADQLGAVATNRLVTAARTAACRVDPDAVRARRVKAETERKVSLRPAPDAMAYLTAFLPVKDALACKAALDQAATDAAKTCDKPRGQVMADTLVERVTGRRPVTGGTDLSVNLLMSLDSLTGNSPAYVPGYGPVPADLVGEWFTQGDPTGPLIRRLFTHPGTGDIIGMESRARRYPGLLALLILLRDQVCRTPWCGAPIRHTDHITRHADGGPTSERNGQGLCARCNYVEEHPDHTLTGDASQTRTTTGGFTAHSYPPAPPGMPPPTRSYLERTLMEITWAHSIAPPGQDSDQDNGDQDNADQDNGERDNDRDD
ncbi:DUF222 domain-containing protein [Flexivirga alba]|uniref:DUF222 domain-containing protein n=1 Tax=Flexivirga alba TaxID=702742 RepID=A0ABW2AMK8_9MICO